MLSAFASASDVTLSTTSNTNTILAGDSKTFTISAYNNNATDNFTITPSSTSISGWTTSFSPTSKVVANKTTESFSYTVTAPASINAGNYTFTVSSPNTADTLAFTLNVLPIRTSLLTASPSSLSLSTQQSTITIKNNGNSNSPIVLSTSGSLNLSLSRTTLSLVPGAQDSFTAVTGFNLSVLSATGSYSSTIIATQDGVQVGSVGLSYVRGVCRLGDTNSANLTLTIDDVSTNGDDDTIWKPLDEVTVKVNVANDGDDDMKNINVRLYLLDKSNGRKNIAGDMNFTSDGEDEIEISRISDGKDEDLEFEFTVPADADFGDYELIVKATSSKQSEDTLCSEEIYGSNPITIQAEDNEDKYLAFNNFDFIPSEGTCSDSVSLSFDVVNVGDEDQDRIKVRLYSSELGVDIIQEVSDGLNQGDSKNLNFEFTVPSGLADKLYSLSIDADYGYSSGSYKQSLGEIVKTYYKVIGCTSSPSGNGALVTTSLSDAAPGEDLTVSITVKNTLSTSSSYVVDAIGYSDWATFKSISERAFTLGAGDSKVVELVLTPNDDASGEQSFTVKVNDVSKSLSVEFPGSSIFSIFGNNQLAWIIGIVNVILIILIIVVAVRVSRN